MVLLAALGELFDFLVFVVVCPAAVFAGRVEAVFALDDDADADLAAIGIHGGVALLAREAANLEDQRRGLVVVDGDFGVGRRRVIVVAEAAAEGEDALGEGL